MKNKTVSIILLICFLLTGKVKAENKDEIPVLRLGLIADIQYCDCESKGTRYYRESLAKLATCVDDLNNAQVNFTANLGDIIDRDIDTNMDPVLKELNRLDSVLYNITGNHDYRGVTDNKLLYSKLGMPEAYYSFEKSGWRFIFLNTNDIASYANIAGTTKELELETMLKRIEESGASNGASYNGGVGKEQFIWLRNILIDAKKKDEKVMIFTHHPLYEAEKVTTLNDTELLELFSGYDCVKAVISGHHHPGAFGVHSGIPYITTEGMIETEKTNAYAVIEIYKNKILLKGEGRTKSYTLPF